MSTFDIRSAIAEVPTAESEFSFTFDLGLARKVRELRAGGDPEALESAEDQLEAATYKVELMAVPRRRREDIYEKSLEVIPGTRDFLGRIDELTEFKRGNYVRVQIVAAAVKRIISPDSGVQDENIVEAIQDIHDKAPDQIFEAFEREVQKLNKVEDEQDELNKSADF